MNFDAINEPSTIYDLTAGAFLLGDVNYRDLHYCGLPSTPNDIPQRTTFNAHGQNRNWTGNIIDVGMAVYQHDLIVNVISYVRHPLLYEFLFSSSTLGPQLTFM